MIRQKKQASLEAVSISIDGYLPEKVKAPVYEHFAGRSSSEPIYNATGCRVEVEAVLVRTYRADPFTLAVRLGNDWYNLARIRADDPGIQALMEAGAMRDYGPAPHELEKLRDKEAARRQQVEAEEADKKARADHNRRIREEAEARYRQAIEERNAGM